MAESREAMPRPENEGKSIDTGFENVPLKIRSFPKCEDEILKPSRHNAEFHK